MQIGLDLLTTATAAAASAGDEEVTAAKNHKVGSFSSIVSEDDFLLLFGCCLITGSCITMRVDGGVSGGSGAEARGGREPAAAGHPGGAHPEL